MCIEVLSLQECDRVSLSEQRDLGVICRVKQSTKTQKIRNCDPWKLRELPKERTSYPTRIDFLTTLL